MCLVVERSPSTEEREGGRGSVGYLAGGWWIEMPLWSKLLLGMDFRKCWRGEETLKHSHLSPFPRPLLGLRQLEC